GDVPYELRAVAHEQRHLLQVRILAAPRDKTKHAGLAGRRVEQAREHLERRGLARAVRAEESDHLACLDAEGDARDRVPCAALPATERSEGRRATLPAPGGPGLLA